MDALSKLKALATQLEDPAFLEKFSQDFEEFRRKNGFTFSTNGNFVLETSEFSEVNLFSEENNLKLCDFSGQNIKNSDIKLNFAA